MSRLRNGSRLRSGSRLRGGGRCGAGGTATAGRTATASGTATTTRATLRQSRGRDHRHHHHQHSRQYQYLSQLLSSSRDPSRSLRQHERGLPYLITTIIVNWEHDLDHAGSISPATGAVEASRRPPGTPRRADAPPLILVRSARRNQLTPSTQIARATPEAFLFDLAHTRRSRNLTRHPL